MNMNMLSNRTGGIPALIFAVLLIISGFSPRNVSAQDYYDNGYNDDYGDYQEFYDDLAPHGQWLNDPQYGYVWTPNAGRDFRPYYTNGHWAMTEYGNMWVSDYSWGWAPFHYGRWAQSSYYGWIWIPGREWGPSWVTWRQGGGYYGWAPMGPGISINFSFGSGYNSPNDWWTFVPCGNIYSRSYNRYYQPRRTVNIINNTTIINNTYVDARSRNTYISGPRRNEVETATRQRVTTYNVTNRTRAGAVELSGRNVNVYRPSIRTVNTRSAELPAPRTVRSVERSVVTNAGGGRAPSRLPAAVENRRAQQVGQPDRSNTIQQRDNQRNAQSGQRSTREVQSRSQQPELQQSNQRGIQPGQRTIREQQVQQQRSQRDVQAEQRATRDQQVQQNRQAEQRQQMMRDQQVQQQRAQEQQQQRMMRDQQQDQQRRVQEQQAEQRQRMMQDQQRQQQQQAIQQQRQQQQQMQQQRSAERQQQMQQRRVEQPQRSVERAQPQRVERSAPAPRERSVERSAR